MKWIILILLLIFTRLISAQVSREEANDSLAKEPFVLRMFYDVTKKNNHILDIEYGMPSVTIGYNYLYRANKLLKVGGRIGTNLYNFNRSPNPTLLSDYKIEALAQVKIWRSLYIQMGVGYYSFIGWDTLFGSTACEDNTTGPCAKFGALNPDMRADISLILFKHLVARGGIQFTYDKIPKNIYHNIGLSLGYHF